MKNAGDPRHPLRTIMELHAIENKWDDAGTAIAVTLSCGHVCVFTGDSLNNVTGVHCLLCAITDGTEKVH